MISKHYALVSIFIFLLAFHSLPVFAQSQTPLPSECTAQTCTPDDAYQRCLQAGQWAVNHPITGRIGSNPSCVKNNPKIDQFFCRFDSKNISTGVVYPAQCGQQGYTNPWTGYLTYWPYGSCPVGSILNSLTNHCMITCSSRPEFTESQQSTTGFVPNGSIGCNDGCLYAHYNNVDGTASGTFLGDSSSFHCVVVPTNCEDSGPGYYMNYGSGMCQPPVQDCKDNQTKDPKTGQCNDTCPSGMALQPDGQCKPSKNTCPAGQVKAPDGSCINDSCPAGKTRGADGTCKKDGDSDKDEGDEDKYFSGGDDCSMPPSCSGDPILCGQARIQWRIDCNTRKNINVSGGSCDAMPVCTGDKCDALEYSQLLMQWRSTCALEKLAGEKNGEGEGEQPGWTKVDGMNQDPASGSNGSDNPHLETRTLSTSDLDTGGWLGGAGSCPAIMSAGGGSGMGSAFAQALASPPGYFCDFIGMMASIVLIGAAVVSSFIISRG